MGYAETLTKMIQESGLTLRQISDRCRDMGNSIAPSYISKLQTGKQAPGSEDVSKALAQACGGNPDLLVWEGHLEKAPDIIREYVSATLPGLKESMRVVFKYMFPPEQVEIIEKSLEGLSPIEFVNMLKSEASNLTSDVGEDGYSIINPDHTDLQINLGEHVGIPMYDDSMQPLIPNKAIVKFKPLQEELINGAIIVIKMEQQIYIRRFYKINEIILLVPENQKYAPMVLSGQDYLIVGQVLSYSLSIKS